MFDNLAIVKTPRAARKLFAAALWKVRTREKILYLTFDDGPIEEVTPTVLDILKAYDAKATFFCVGKNIESNPDIFHRIITEGHLIGNHTQDHLNGWNTANKAYFENIDRCTVSIHHHLTGVVQTTDDNRLWYRPPYGKLSPGQYNYLKDKYKIVMWDVLTFDFDLKVTKEKVLDNAVQYSRPGSILVFHDSLKAKEKVLYALPKVLEHFSALGYRFEVLS